MMNVLSEDLLLRFGRLINALIIAETTAFGILRDEINEKIFALGSNCHAGFGRCKPVFCLTRHSVFIRFGTAPATV
jgi:hypothetical protein